MCILLNIKRLIYIFILITISQTSLSAYPLDGFDETGITRLEGYFHSLPTETSKRELTTGAMLALAEIGLSLKNKSPLLTSNTLSDQKLKSLLNNLSANSASVSIINFSDNKNIQYFGNNDSKTFIPGSVGKIFVAVSLFATLADLYPGSIDKRREILRTKIITATNFVVGDSHDVPFWDLENRKIYYRPLKVGDAANIWTYLDWTLSASSNAAASMLMREVILMNAFKDQYPVSSNLEHEFFSRASPSEISSLMRKSFIRKFYPNQSDTLYQASTFTKTAKKALPSAGSTATTRGLATFLFNLEQGRVVDSFSSIEIKRLLYATQKRVRYAAAPILNNSALYFKSGSLYSCRPEANFACGKYRGNRINILNAAAVIESPAAGSKNRYISVISSNILKRDSEKLHRDLAEKIHNFILML